MEIAWKIIIYSGIFIVGFTAISLWNFYSVTRPVKITTYLVPSDFDLPEKEITLETKEDVKKLDKAIHTKLIRNAKENFDID